MWPIADSDASLERPARSLRHQVAALLVAGMRCSPFFVVIAVFAGPVTAGGSFRMLFRGDRACGATERVGRFAERERACGQRSLGCLARDSALQDIQRQAEKLPADSLEQ